MRRIVDVESIERSRGEALARALASADVDLLYRPVASSALDGVAGLRSQLRWASADHGVLHEDELVETAVRHDLDAALDRHVIRDAATRLDEWAHTSDGTVVWASLSGHSGVDPVVDEIVRAGRSCAAGRHRLGVRWPADVLDAADPDALGEIRRSGVGVMAGQVTPGHAVLGRLEEHTIDVVQLDGQLVRSVTESDDSVEAVAEIIRTVARHGVPAVAAGVDHNDILAVVERLGIDQVEGVVAGRAEPPLIVGMLLQQVLAGLR